jgi:hypothetical protein
VPKWLPRIVAAGGREQGKQAFEVRQRQVVEHVPTGLRRVGGERDEQVHAAIIRAALGPRWRVSSGSIAPA